MLIDVRTILFIIATLLTLVFVFNIVMALLSDQKKYAVVRWYNRFPIIPAVMQLLYLRTYFDERLELIEPPPTEVYRRIWGFNGDETVHIVIPDDRADQARPDGGTPNAIDPSGLSFPTSELQEGTSYTISVTPERVERSNGQNPRKVLYYNDSRGIRQSVTLFSDRTDRYEETFRTGQQYVFTDVQYSCNVKNGREYHNLHVEDSPADADKQPFDEPISLNTFSFETRGRELDEYGVYDIELAPHTVKVEDDRRVLYYNDADGTIRNVTIWDQRSSLYELNFREGQQYRFEDVQYERNEGNPVFHDFVVTSETELVNAPTTDPDPVPDRNPMLQAVIHVYGGLLRLYDDIDINIVTASEFEASSRVQNENLVFVGTKEYLDDINIDYRPICLGQQDGTASVWTEGQKPNSYPNVSARDSRETNKNAIVDGGAISKQRNPNDGTKTQFVVTGTSNKSVIGASKALLTPNLSARNESLTNCNRVLESPPVAKLGDTESFYFDAVFKVHTRHGDPEIPTRDDHGRDIRH